VGTLCVQTGAGGRRMGAANSTVVPPMRSRNRCTGKGLHSQLPLAHLMFRVSGTAGPRMTAHHRQPTGVLLSTGRSAAMLSVTFARDCKAHSGGTASHRLPFPFAQRQCLCLWSCRLGGRTCALHAAVSLTCMAYFGRCRVWGAWGR